MGKKSNAAAKRGVNRSEISAAIEFGGASRCDVALMSALPTRERYAHGTVEYGAREVTDGGVVAIIGAKAVGECLIDRLYLGGDLGCDTLHEMELAVERRDTAVALRELYLAGTETKSVCAGYETRCGGTSTGDMSDEQAEAWAKFGKLMRQIRPYDSAVMAICCYDKMPTWEKGKTIRDALDRLKEVWGR